MSMLDEKVYEGLADFVASKFFAHEDSKILKMTGELYQADETKIPNLWVRDFEHSRQSQAVTGQDNARIAAA